MVDHKDEKKDGAAPRDKEKTQPSLPAEFFLELLDAPACKSKGYCDNCGRCEH